LFTLVAYAEVPSKNTAFVDALWVAESGRVLKIAEADGSVLLQIPNAGEPSALTVDASRATLWAYGRNTLTAYDFAGNRRLAVPLSGTRGKDDDDEDDEGKAVGLALDPNDGSVWLGRDRQLYHIDSQGQVFANVRLDDRLQGLSFDAVRSRVWTATSKHLSAYDTLGQRMQYFTPTGSPELNGLAYDAGLDALWVADHHEQIRRYRAEDGVLQLQVKIAEHPDTLVPDEHGGLWLGAGATLIKLGSDGNTLLRLTPITGKDKKLLALAADPVTAGVWVAAKQALRYVDADGRAHPALALANAGQKLKIRALAPYTDLLAPQLNFSAPANHSAVSTQQPQFELHYQDSGIGVDTASLAVSEQSGPLPVTCRYAADTANCTPTAPLAEGAHTLQAAIADYNGNRSASASLDFTIDTIPPAIILDNAGETVTNQANFTLAGHLTEAASLSLDAVPLSVNADLYFSQAVTLVEGPNTYSFTSSDAADNSATASVRVTLDTVPPQAPATGQIQLSPPEAGTVTVTGAAGSVEANASLTLTNTSSGATITVTADSDGRFSAQIAAQAGDSLGIRLTDAAGNQSEPYSLAVAGSAGELPPDPATVAPALTATAITPLHTASAFLYSGSKPIQTGVSEGTIEAKRAAVIRGKVLDNNRQPLSGVVVTIKDHAEYGQTLSRADGQFDMAVNGGGQLTIDYQKSGYLPVQRRIQTPWQDYVVTEDVIMLTLDAQVTAIDLNAAAPQIAEGSQMTDADGSRQAVVLFPAGTQATMTLPDGTQQALTALHVRATEYTVGENGPKAMPGPLPPSSGYTYAVELSADEAIAVGAKTVSFDRPVPFYVDNFLNFPVGETVPAGWYDRDKAAWIPSGNGKVIKILSIIDGLAGVDSDGDGQADDAAKLAVLGIDAAERQQLALLYTSGKTVWRTPIKHFTPWDCNWPFGPPKDAVSPPPRDDTKDPPPESDCKLGCSINAQERTMGEALPVTGTPYTLHYQSRRAKGYQPDRNIDIPLAGASIPASLKGIDLTVTVAGQNFTRSFTAAPNQNYRFEWDGLDGYGRAVTESAKATITVSYRYTPVYYAARADFDQSFAQASAAVGTAVIGSRMASTIVVTRNWQKPMDGDRMAAQALGGWSLSPHHSYDAVNQNLEMGSGEHRKASKIGQVITTVAGNGNGNVDSGDGGLATHAGIRYPSNITFAPDGSLYISNQWCVRRAGVDGIITTVAGNCKTVGYAGDGGLATAAKLWAPRGIAVSTDGSLYIADSYNHRIRRVGTDGIITTVAGTGQSGYAGDGGPAAAAQLSQPTDVAFGADGSLYIADFNNNQRIRKVGTDGFITTIAGNGLRGYSGDGGPATQAKLLFPESIALSPDGVLYFSTDSQHIRRVGVDGVISSVAGSGVGYAGDGGLATQARFNFPKSVAIGQNDSLYIADYYNDRVRRVDADGIINTVAGGNGRGYAGDEGPSTQAKLYLPQDVAIGPDGSLYIADTYNSRIRRVAQPLPGYSLSDVFIPSSDSSELYHFDANGKHLRTLNALTRAVLYSFSYDATGLLSNITDVNGDSTRIERDSAGNAIAIIAPDGQRTALTLGANGYLSGVTNPAGETYSMGYTADGLLTSFTDPNGHANTFSYDDLGRLSQDLDAGGGGWTITATERTTGYTTAMTTGEGHTTQFAVDYLSTGERRHTNTYPDGSVQTRLFNPNNYQETVTAPDGTVTTTLKSPDPRFGMLAPLSASTVTTSSGLTATITRQRNAVLANANDLLSLTTLTETATINGKTATSTYNASTQTITHTSPAGRTATTTLNAQSRPVKQAIPGLADVDLSYDSRGRLSGTTQGAGSDTRTATLAYYDSGASQGYLHTVTDALNRTISYDYDLAGRVTQQTLPDGRAIAYGYDAKGNLTSLTPPGRPAHLFDYTAVDQTQDYTPPAVNTNDPATRYSYNKDKQLELITRPDGQTLDFIYDSAGRLKTLSAPHGDTGYAYDSAGRLQSLSAPGSIALSYNYDGSLLTNTSLTGPVTGSVSRSYDNDFRTQTLTVNGANTISLNYDNDSLLTGVGDLSLTRNAQNGQLTGTALGQINDNYSDNSFGETQSYQANVGAAPLIQWNYQRDNLGRISHREEIIQGITHIDDYAYDLAGRLIEVKQNGSVTASYGYDNNGNRTDVNGQTIAHYDDQDRLSNYNGNTYSYTENGELKTKTVGADAAAPITAYDYDVFGNLKHVTLPDNTQIDYLIDGQNRRIGKKVNGVLVQGFLYQNPIKPIAELDGNNNVVTRFVYGDKGNVPAYLIKIDPNTQSQTTYRIISDHLGSPRLVINVNDGSIAQALNYDVWGNVIHDSNPGFQPFGYAGGIYDRDTKLVRFGARDYDAETGRWTVKDPIGFWGGDSNLYGYVVNDPVNRIDPMGLRDTSSSGSGSACDTAVTLCDTNAGKLWDKGYPYPARYLLENCDKSYRQCKDNERQTKSDPLGDYVEFFPPKPHKNGGGNVACKYGSCVFVPPSCNPIDNVRPKK